MPDSLLIYPCEAVSAGSTVRTLAKAYVSNTSCIGQYKLLLEKQIEWKKQQEQIYKPSK